MDAAALYRLLEARVRDLAARGRPSNRDEHRERSVKDRVVLEKALGLYPQPPRTDLRAEITGEIPGDGYRIEKLRYESRPGLLVTAHLYVPAGPGPFPVVLHPHGHWRDKKATPWVQARGISLALYGIAGLVVDSPGYSFEECDNEREGMGQHDDPFLAMGAPVTGQYVWDLVRGLDYLATRPEFDVKRVGITGASGGGTTSMYAFAYDERILAAVPVVAAASMEVQPHNGCLCNHLPGVSLLGDRSDVLALRAPCPVLLIGATDDPEFPPDGMRRTHEKLQGIYSLYKAEADARIEIVFGPHDYNRRMRESMVAFFLETLKREPRRPHVPELRPMVDGTANPAPAGTIDPRDPILTVTAPDNRATRTFRELLETSLREPHPTPYQVENRLAPWGKFGRVEPLAPRSVLRIHDAGTQASGDSVELPVGQLDHRLLIFQGMSSAEFLAQILHHQLPGHPEGWETPGLQGDALTAMIASVKTLVQGHGPDDAPKSLEAAGPLASLTALFLRKLRPDLQVRTSHGFTRWDEVLALGLPDLAQPGARYMEFPSAPSVDAV